MPVSLRWLLAAAFSTALGVFAVRYSPPTPEARAADPPREAPGVTVYDPDPGHLWNRLQVLVLLPAAFRTRALFDTRARELGLLPRVAAEVNSVEGILATVRSSGAATVLPVLALADREVGLRAVNLTEPVLRQTLGLAWRRGCYHSRAFNAFVEYARAVAEELPA